MSAGRPSVGKLVAGGARWWAIFTVGFFFTLPLWGRPLLRAVGAVLGALNDFGSGM